MTPLSLDPYRRVALQFSGGKDSLACLYLLRDQLDVVTVYWCDTGDGCPETRAIIEQVRAWVPHFAVVRSDVASWRLRHGFPSDLVPSNHHPIGLACGLGQFPLVNRWDCCAANLMLPLHERMVADGVDAVVRGTKLCDMGTLPAEGRVAGVPYDILLPIRDWSHQDVFAYLQAVGAPQNAIYEHFAAVSAPECMGCTAWWNDGKAAYLRARHPNQAAGYQVALQSMLGAVHTQLADLYAELHTLTKRL